MNTFISIDLEKCTGCRCCEMACSLHNDNQCNPEKARIRAIKSEDDGRVFTLPIVCQQCEKAPCLEFCPSGAMYRKPETGAIVVDENKCIGCKRCVFVCPFGIPFIDEYRGVSVKCNLCDGSPKCVEICPKDALTLTQYDKMSIKKKREKVDKYIAYQHTKSL
jgi:Fe-S-cluster-containing hydrogenase component 2